MRRMILLTAAELEDLTGSAKPFVQRRELDHMRIPYYVRRNGIVLVRRADVESSKRCLPCNESASLPPQEGQDWTGAKLATEPQVQR